MHTNYNKTKMQCLWETSSFLESFVQSIFVLAIFPARSLDVSNGLFHALASERIKFIMINNPGQNC